MKLNIERVEVEMAKKLLTKKELCERSNLSQYGVHKILSGISSPTPATIGKLAIALGVSVEHLIGKEN